MSLIIPGGAHVPQDVQDRLKQIDPRMYVQPKQRAIFDSGAETDRPEMQWQWYVVLKWPDNDPRWRMVKYGQIDPENAFDLLGAIPVDCPLEQVPGYLARQLKRSNGVAGQIVDNIAEWNRDQEIRNGEPVSEFAEELFKANAVGVAKSLGKTFVKPVYQNNPTGKKNKPKEA